MNFVAKGERFSSSKKEFVSKVQELMTKPVGEGFREAMEIAKAHSRGDTAGKTISATSLAHRAGVELNHSILENIPDNQTREPWEDIDERNGWTEPNEQPQTVSPIKSNPRKVGEGTKVQNLKFHGGFEISRRMASYWRKKRSAEYKVCCEFILGLLKQPWPRSPSVEGMAFNIPMLNALLAEDIKRRLKPVSKAVFTEANGNSECPVEAMPVKSTKTA